MGGYISCCWGFFYSVNILTGTSNFWGSSFYRREDYPKLLEVNAARGSMVHVVAGGEVTAAG